MTPTREQVELAAKSAAPLPLSWQPPPVTKCVNCPRAEIHDNEAWCSIAAYEPNKFREWDVYEENKDGITPSCPMWQQQNKEKL